MTPPLLPAELPRMTFPGMVGLPAANSAIPPPEADQELPVMTLSITFASL